MTLRPMLPDERRWVAGTWMTSWKLSKGYHGGQMPLHAVALIDAVIDIPGAVLVYDIPGVQAAGWIAWSPGSVHYIYVVFAMRRQGVARALVNEVARHAPIYTATIITDAGRALALRLTGRLPRIDPWPRLRSCAAAPGVPLEANP